MAVIVRHPSDVELEPSSNLPPAVDGTLPVHKEIFVAYEDGPTSLDVGHNKYRGPRAGGPVIYPGFVEVCYLPKGEHYQLTQSGALVHVREGSFAIRLEGSTSWVITPKELESICFFSPGRPANWSGKGVPSDVGILQDPLYIHPDEVQEFDDPAAETPGTVRSRDILTAADTRQASVRWSVLGAGACLRAAVSGSDRMIHLLKGEITITVDGVPQIAAEGSYISWPAGDGSTITTERGATLFTVSSPAEGRNP
jgi:hypothetical protein